MVLLRRILPVVSPLFLAVFFSGLHFNPIRWQLWITGAAVVLLLTIGAMVKWKIFSAQFFISLFPALSLVCGGIGYYFFLSAVVWQIVFFIVVAILYGVYLEALFIYYYQPQRYKNLSLSNYSFFVNIFSVFTLCSLGFALLLIRVVSIWVLVIAAIVYSICLVLHMLYIYKIWKKEHLQIVLLIALLSAELIWVLHFLPTAYYINGIIAAIVLYCVPNIIQYHLRDSLSKKVLWQTIGVSIVALIVVLSTSQWI